MFSKMSLSKINDMFYFKMRLLHKPRGFRDNEVEMGEPTRIAVLYIVFLTCLNLLLYYS
jgi:hypothetical protein